MRRIRSGVLRRAGRMRSSLSSSSSSCRTSSRNFGSSWRAARPSWILVCRLCNCLSWRSYSSRNGSSMRQEPAAKSSPPTTSPTPSPTYQGFPSSPVFNATGPALLSRRRRDRRLGPGTAAGGLFAGAAGPRVLVLVLGVRRERVVEIDHEFIDAAPLLLRALQDGLVELRHLVEVLDEAGDGVGVEGAAFEIDGIRRHLHAVQPEQLRQGAGDVVHHPHGPALVGLQVVDDADLALQLRLLRLVVLDLLDDAGHRVDLVLGRGHLRRLLVHLLVQQPPVDGERPDADREADEEQPLADVAPLQPAEDGCRGLGLADGPLAFGEQVDLDHRPSPPPCGSPGPRRPPSWARSTAATGRRSRLPCTGCGAAGSSAPSAPGNAPAGPAGGSG